MESVNEDFAMRRGKEQLDLLLLKAESYTRFIEQNQKRSKDMFAARSQITKSTDATPNSKKRPNEEANTGSAKKKVKGDSPTAVSSAGEDSLISVQPPNLTGGELMSHQLEGLMWLLSLWENGLNGILADEMGLGKTIQIIALIAHLRHHKTSGPYLIVAPLATLGNWMKEFAKWLPSCPVLMYHGDKEERAALRQSKLQVNLQKTLDFPVVITSFEIAMADRQFLEKYVWQYLIMDEGHRIKNRQSKLFKDLKSLQSISRLLLTGTPIQNSLEELWSLLNFCTPLIFDDLEVFQSWFSFRNIGQETKVEDIIDEEEKNRVVTKLHDILRPFVLRRMKKDVLQDKITLKKEVIVYCGMSLLQSEYYARVCDNTLRHTLLSMGVDRRVIGSQINVQMNHRKVANHPFLFGDIPDSSGKPIQDSDPMFLVSSSGKFKLLHRMLTRLKQENHKVILFTQFTGILDLLEDYMHHMKYGYLRLDGSTKWDERQDFIDTFNKDKDIFIFLLSTRAGGLGVNLTAADTAILFDSDWNPHMDAQAQDRCHRIGQLNNVAVYRYLTSNSVDIEMIKKQFSKKKLERLAIHSGDFRSVGRRRSGQFTIEELKRMLSDDVKSLDRGDRSEGQNGDWLHKDISDEELDLIMDRGRLFAGADSGDALPNEGEMFDIAVDLSVSLLQTIE